MLYRFRCWEQHDADVQPSLIATDTRSGRLAFFDTQDELTFDITSMATTKYEADGEPLIAVAVASQPKGITLYATLDDLSNGIAGLQDDPLWRLLVQTTRSLAPEHRVF